jgi:hypothetical protein
MELNQREKLFVLKEMERIEHSEDRQTYEQYAAGRVREEAESEFTE